MGVAGGGKNPLEVGAVAELAFDELRAGRQQVAAAVAQVVVNNGLIPFFGQKSRNCTSDIPCTASNQDLHKRTVLSKPI